MNEKNKIRMKISLPITGAIQIKNLVSDVAVQCILDKPVRREVEVKLKIEKAFKQKNLLFFIDAFIR